MKRHHVHTSCTVLTVFAVLASFVVWPAGAQSGGDVDGNEDLFSHIDKTLDDDIEDLVAMGKGEKPGDYEQGDDIEREIVVEGQWGGNHATSNENPFLTEDCHKDAMLHAITTMKDVKNMDTTGQAVEMAKMHMTERQADFDDGITYSDYIAHIAECKGFCGPMVKKLLGCHVNAVRNLKHEIVFFKISSYNVEDGRSADAISEIARHLRNYPDEHAILIGRASLIGPLGYNRRLSGQRADTVRSMLYDMGVEKNRLKALAFGYEPPQIDATIARAYDLYDLYNVPGGNYKVNQSVMVVVYKPGEHSDHDHG